MKFDENNPDRTNLIPSHTSMATVSCVEGNTFYEDKYGKVDDPESDGSHAGEDSLAIWEAVCKGNYDILS